MINYTTIPDEGIFPRLILTRGTILGVLSIDRKDLLICLKTIGYDYFTNSTIEENINISYSTKYLDFLNKVISPFVRIINNKVNYEDLVNRNFLITLSIYYDKEGYEMLSIHSLAEDKDIIALYTAPKTEEEENKDE